jgi:hypothetical protein
VQRIALSADILPRAENFYSRRRLKDVRNDMRDTVRTLKVAIDPIESAKRAKSLALAERDIAKFSKKPSS